MDDEYNYVLDEPTDTSTDTPTYTYTDTPTDTSGTLSAGDQEFQDFMSGAAGDQEFQDFMSGAAGDQDFEDFMTEAAKADPAAKGILASAIKAFGAGAKDFIKKYFYNSETGKFNFAGVATAGLALYSLLGKGSEVEKGGYNTPVPTFTATRKQVQYDDTNRRPGAGGRSYFTPTQFTAPADAGTAQSTADTQAQGILAGYTPRAAEVNPYAGKFRTPWEAPPAATAPAATAPASGVAQLMPVPNAATYDPVTGVKTMADGGIAALARGRYLAGKTDGMADKIPTSIDGKDPAALSHGEFVIPADVVSHLGNGNSEAGAEKLYAMMDKVRKARTGTTQQGKRINPDKFMPGGLAGYAGGGAVKKFDGTSGSLVPTTTSTTAPTTTAPNMSTSSSLSPWAGPYVTNMLGRAEALGSEPYQAYTGPLSAGASDLQNQAFAGIGTLAGAGYTPTTYSGGTFGAQQAQQYMNPYIQAALDPQLAAMRREADIQRTNRAAKMTQAGAFGGTRQAVEDALGTESLQRQQAQTIGTGYQTAFDKAMGQYNTDQERRLGAEKATEASRQYSSDFGLKSLDAMARLGQTQRDIESEGIAADKAEFERQRDYPASMIKFQRDLVTGLPITTTDTSATTDAIGRISGQINDLVGLYKTLSALGQ